MKHAPSSTTHLNINNINITGDIFNQVNNYYPGINGGVNSNNITGATG